MRVAAPAIRIGLFFFALVAIASAQPGPPDPLHKNAFLSRKKWYLSFSLSLKGSGDVTTPGEWSGSSTTSWSIDRELSGEVVLDSVSPGDGPVSIITPLDPAGARGGRVGRFITWRVADPRGKSVNYRINDLVRNEVLGHGEGGAPTREWNFMKVEDAGSLPLTHSDDGFWFACDLVDMTFDVSLATIVNGLGGGGEFPPTATITGENSLNEPPVLPLKTQRPGALLPQGKLPHGNEPLWQALLGRKLELRDSRIAFTVSVPITALPEPYSGKTDGGTPLELSLNVVILPSPPSRVKLILTPQGYVTWRPKCSDSEDTKGNELKVDWRAEEEGGDSAEPPKVTGVVFSLRNTSREPGVCMNYPIQPKKPADFDLKFETTKTPPAGYTVTSDGQKLTLSGTQVSSGKGSATVESFDSGAWSDLSVTADLEDGRTITGHLKDNPSAPVVPLPKRARGSYIADAWKAERGITAGDNDDSEKPASAGKTPGDGFTLYEEYRGFVVDGEYIEGDPKKIDFFVRNYIGGDARPGIDLFARLTGAEVHDRLRDAEFDPEKRVMNANHDRGPHRVDQHGVYLRTRAGLDGAEAKFSTGSLRGRPRLCLEIAVQPRGAATSVTTSENVPVADLVFAYDRAIAHELLHAVGVEHHGHRDYTMNLWLNFFDTPGNKSGKPYFETSGIIVTITDEATGRDLAAMLEPDRLLAREALRPIVAPIMKDKSAAEFDLMLNLVRGTYSWYVGAEHGESSGDEDCVSRYYFARLYQKKGVPRAYYYISDQRSERASLGLCHTRAGSGINASGRKPQPRYGDSNAGWGDCADWIVFNDAAPDERAPAP